MTLENERCRIEVKTDETYTVDSADNRHYDVILNPGRYRHNDFSKILSIHVDLFSNEFYIALIGSFYSYDSDCAILENDTLTVLQGDAITQIRVTDGTLVRHIRLDGFGCNFAIYKVSKGYIVYGEIEITMLDFDFLKKWSFCGKDIFVSVSGQKPFELNEDGICLRDIEGNCYQLDFDGGLVG